MDFIIPIVAFLGFYFLLNLILSIVGLIDNFCAYLAGIMQAKLADLVGTNEEVHTECIGFQIPSKSDEEED